jgi:hypothetical protein
MPRISVLPVRSSHRPRDVQKFLELIGLRTLAGADDEIRMRAAGGQVELSARGHSGQTRLSFETDDLEALAARLTEAGVPDVVLSETGRPSLTCRDPLGDAVAIRRRAAGHHPGPLPLTTIVPVRFTDPAGPYAQFLSALGLRPTSDSSEYHVNFGGDRPSDGQVRLHYPYRDDPPVVAGDRAAAVQLTFESAEPLEVIAARLRAAGHEPAIVVHKLETALEVVDPDGQQVDVAGAATGTQ